MRQYQWLAEDDRTKRRTIADAIEVLRQLAGFSDNDRAQIIIGLMELPSADLVGLVQILFDASETRGYAVSLPTSRQFNAVREGGLRPDLFDIDQLHGARVDGAGRVELLDGMMLRAIKVKPAKLPLDPSDLDWRIVHHTIAFIRAQEKCYRSLKDSVPEQYREMTPDLKFLDCRKLLGLEIPSLESIATYIADKDPTLKKLSRQKIADALAKFGMRIPKRRGKASNAP